MTVPLSISEMLTPLWTVAPAFQEKCSASSLIDGEAGQTLPYAVLNELARHLISCLRNGAYSNETGQEFRSLTGRLFQRYTGRVSEAKPDSAERPWV
jgi:hypothetical protein